MSGFDIRVSRQWRGKRMVYRLGRGTRVQFDQVFWFKEADWLRQ